MPDIKLSSSEINEICELLNSAGKIVIDEDIQLFRKNRIIALLEKVEKIIAQSLQERLSDEADIC